MADQPDKKDTPAVDTDTSRYIRTYAKDMAALSGASRSTPTSSTGAVTANASANTEEADGVITEKIDESVVTENRIQEDVAAKRDARYNADADALSPEKGSTSVNELDKTSAPASAPLSGMMPHMTAPDPAREDVLARLRNRVAQSKSPQPRTPLPTAAPSAPQVSNTVITPSAEPIPRIPPVSRTIDAAAPLPYVPSAPVEKGPSPLHTYTTDFSDRIDSRKASTFSVLAAEADAGKLKARPAKKKTNALPAILGVLLIVVGAGAVYIAYNVIKSSAPVTITGVGVPSLISYDDKKEVSGVGTELQRSISDVATASLPTGSVLITYVSSATTTEKGVVATAQPGGVVIQQMQLPAPDILLRNLSIESTVGIVHAGDETRPFFVMKSTSYERSRYGMLAWEPTIASDLAILYPPYAMTAVAPVATSTATSTPRVVTPKTFTDAVIANHDVRVLRDASGRSILLYGYYDKETFVIARDEAAFTELVRRLGAAATPTQ